MIVFTVHEPDGLAGRGPADADRIVFVKDGFCWPALIIPVLWLAYRRMWLVLVAYLAAAALLEAAGRWLAGPAFTVAAGLAFAMLFALLANDLRRWQLARRGHRMRAVVTGRDREECERAFFAGWLAAAPPARRAPAPPPPPPVMPRATPAGAGVVGLFPEPGKG